MGTASGTRYKPPPQWPHREPPRAGVGVGLLVSGTNTLLTIRPELLAHWAHLTVLTGMRDILVNLTGRQGPAGAFGGYQPLMPVMAMPRMKCLEATRYSAMTGITVSIAPAIHMS